MESNELKNAILSNLELIKNNSISSQLRQVKSDSVKEEEVEQSSQINDDPDELVKSLPKFTQTTFDYAAKQFYFDDIYFRNSKLINL